MPASRRLSRPSLLLVLLPLVVLASGCDVLRDHLQRTKTPPPERQLMPLAVGNRWVMNATVNGRPRGTDTLRVTDSLRVDGVTWHTVRSTSGILQGLLQNRVDGLYRRPATRLYPVGLPAGARVDTPNGYVEVLDPNARVTLPDGRVVAGARYAEWTTRATLGTRTLPLRMTRPAEYVFAYGVGPVHLECAYIAPNATGDSLVVVSMLRLDLLRADVAR